MFLIQLHFILFTYGFLGTLRNLEVITLLMGALCYGSRVLYWRICNFDMSLLLLFFSGCVLCQVVV